MRRASVLFFYTITLIFIIVSCNRKAEKRDITGNDYLNGMNLDSIMRRAASFVPEVGKYGGSLILPAFSDPKSFNPILATDPVSSEYASYIFDGLVRLNGVTGLPEPGLAERWEVSENGLRWIFFIQKGAMWSDSTPFSAYDVEFTFTECIYKNPTCPNSLKRLFTIEGERIDIEAVDSNTICFTLPVSFAPFLHAMTQNILPKHKYEQAVKSGAFLNVLNLKTAPGGIVGNGPFLLESYIPLQKVVLKRNRLYWRKDSAGNRLPYLDKIIYSVVSDRNQELKLFIEEKIDYISARGEDYAELEMREADGEYVIFRLGPARGSNFLFFNQNTGTDPSTGKSYVDEKKLNWFRNRNFRKAVAYSINKQKMIEKVMMGMGFPQWSPTTPAEGYFYNGEVKRYPYDTVMARKILAQEGFFDRDGDGFLEDDNENVVEFTLLTNAGNQIRLKLAEMICNDLRKIGLNVQFQQVEFGMLEHRIDNPPYVWEAILLGLTGWSEPHFAHDVWMSDGALHMWFPKQAAPSTPWEAAIDSIFIKGVREIDLGKRKQLYDKWQQVAADELPMIYTVLPERILCISRKFNNINPSQYGGILHNIEEIYVK